MNTKHWETVTDILTAKTLLSQCTSDYNLIVFVLFEVSGYPSRFSRVSSVIRKTAELSISIDYVCDNVQ